MSTVSKWIGNRIAPSTATNPNCMVDLAAIIDSITSLYGAFYDNYALLGWLRDLIDSFYVLIITVEL